MRKVLGIQMKKNEVLKHWHYGTPEYSFPISWERVALKTCRTLLPCNDLDNNQKEEELQ